MLIIIAKPDVVHVVGKLADALFHQVRFLDHGNWPDECVGVANRGILELNKDAIGIVMSGEAVLFATGVGFGSSEEKGTHGVGCQIRVPFQVLDQLFPINGEVFVETG